MQRLKNAREKRTQRLKVTWQSKLDGMLLVHIYTHTYVHTYKNTYMHTYSYAYTHTYVYITHTYIYTVSSPNQRTKKNFGTAKFVLGEGSR